MADNTFGVILQNKLRTNLSPEIGEIQNSLETSELVTKANDSSELEFRYIDLSFILRRYGITKTHHPSIGEDGDWNIPTEPTDPYFEHFTINGSSTKRELGFTKNELDVRFEPKVDWSNKLTRDGTVKFDLRDYKTLYPTFNNLQNTNLVIKEFADDIISNTSSQTYVNKLYPGSGKSMVNNYVPIKDGDVLTVKSLTSGDLAYIPPTQPTGVSGAMWNDNGTLRFES